MEDSPLQEMKLLGMHIEKTADPSLLCPLVAYNNMCDGSQKGPLISGFLWSFAVTETSYCIFGVDERTFE